MAIPIDQETIREYFKYIPEKGELVWRYSPSKDIAWNSRNAGKIAGSVSRITGYRQVGVDKRKLLAHRIIWVYFNGPIPDGMVVDHINRDRGDNRIENLRLLSHEENVKNCDRWDRWIAMGVWGANERRGSWVKASIGNRVPESAEEFEEAGFLRGCESRKELPVVAGSSPVPLIGEIEQSAESKPTEKRKTKGNLSPARARVQYINRRGILVPTIVVFGIRYEVRDGQDPEKFRQAIMSAEQSLRAANQSVELQGEAA